MKSRNAFFYFLSSFTVAMILAACGGGGGSSGGTDDDDGGTDTPSGGIVDENGSSLASVNTTDAVRLSLTGLDPNEQYTITVTGPDGTELNPEGGFIATSDEDGAIPTSTLLQDLSTTESDASIFLWKGGVVPRLRAETGDYNVVVADADGNEILSDSFSVVDDDKVFCSDSTGTARGSFLPSETVYATLDRGDSGDLEDGSYSCYVSSDLAGDWEDGDTLSGTEVTVTVASGVGVVALGSYELGTYDVACDIDDDGLFTEGTDVHARAGRFHPCFTIQDANSGGDIIGQVCADRNGNYRDVFDPNATDSNIRDVFAWIAPQERSLVQHAIGVRKYVVAHQDSWTDGDALTDVTGPDGAGAFDVDSVQGFCTNEAPWLVWSRERLLAGCYDCIIDVNADGDYDEGTDFVDNIDNTGDNTTCGMRVADSSCSDDYILVTSHEDEETVTDTTVVLEGTIAEEVTSGSITITSGAQSNIINLDVSNVNSENGTVDFSATLPLFNGDNLITITAVQADGTACSKTITITSSSEASENQLFRVQLTWDGDTDMDLHLVKPEGVYANAGTSSDSDCYYSNCKVGLDGEEGTGDSGENHSIDWGTLGDASDDAYLDVDCIACGSGIENIWMNSISEDGNYNVYVDAYSGTETAVTVTIFIRGSTVGTVSCGEMTAYAATDSCFVGTIAWTGGDEGSGIFTASGTKASDF